MEDLGCFLLQLVAQRVVIPFGDEVREEKLFVVGVKPRELVELAHLVADDQAKIPERVQEAAKELLVGAVNRALEQNQDVDVRMKAEMTPPVAAQGDHEDAARRM